jgi:anti-sigma factor RsiW
MMTCRRVVELLIDYVSGELPPEHREVVDRHLHGCPPCVAFVESYQLTIRLTRQLPCEPLPGPLVERLKACLRSIDQGQCREGGPAEGGAG